MSSLIARIRNVVNANAHHAVDQTENPEIMVKQVLREMREHLAKARHSQVFARAAEKRLAREHEQQTEQATIWRGKAEAALKAGDEQSARDALSRAVELEQHAQSLSAPLEKARLATARAGERIVALEKRLDSTRRQFLMLRSRQRVAETGRMLSKTLGTDVRGNDFETRIEEMTLRVDDLECEADAAIDFDLEVTQPVSNIDSVIHEKTVDDALEQLKSEISH